MCVINYYIFIITLYIINCNALNCRSDGGPKEEDLKKIYKSCMKMQEGKNSSDTRKISSDQDWNEYRGHNPWDKDGRSNRDKTNNRDDRMGVRDKFGGKDYRMGDREDRMGNRDDRLGNRDDRMDNRNDRVRGRDEMEGRDDPMNDRRNGMRDRNRDMTSYHDDGTERYHLNGRDDFQSDEYGSDMSRRNYYSSTQPSRRFRRDRHKEVNSGHRSQYNPNAQKPTEYDDSYRNEEKNSSRNSSKDDDNKACALHCFLEHLAMIGDNGMPDKYLVTHVLTKDVKNDDLRDFLQESIEECFQIIDNENTEEKCEFSKNLMLCLSEKGRVNCDDWKDDLKF